MSLSSRATFPRGIHPPELKEATRDLAVEVLQAPERVEVPLLQHLGAPCEPVVAARDRVEAGTLIGEGTSPVSAAVHAPISGKTTKVGVCTLPNGRHVPMVPIKAEGDQLQGRVLWDDHFGGDWPYEGIPDREPRAIVEAIRAAGIVGLGGAAFPTHVKLSPSPNKPIDTLVVNGCECEPCLTADDRLMREAPQPIVAGALLAARAVGAGRVIFGVEANKPEAIAALRDAAAGTAVEVSVVETKYPQGGEKQLILALLGRKVPNGGLPLDIGVVVVNVATAAAIARAVLRGRPLTHRIVSVSGNGVVEPKNLLVPVGTSYGEVLRACGGLREDAVRVVAGGPMMGFAIGDLTTPITKGSSGILALTRGELAHSEETNCVRCGRCVQVCPMQLVPTKIALAARAGDLGLLEKYHAAACMECGCCAHQCPAGLPLVQLIRVGKAGLAA